MLVPFRILQVTCLILFYISPLVTSHTWIEQLMVIASNGTMVGQPGFARNNVLRSSPTFSDSTMVWLVPPNGGVLNHIDANQSMCRPEQTTQTQSAGSPRLQASPGSFVALRYQENGHVTLPQNQPGKPDNRGANFVYFTTQSSPDDKFLQIHRQWTADGKGGDGRGRLISTQNFDDGQCYQVNNGQISVQRQAEFKHRADQVQGANLWCQQDIRIPTDAQVGSTVTLYWVWDWPTLPGTAGFPQGKQELYTTCMDIDIVAGPAQAKAAAQGFVRQDFGHAAVATQLASINNPTAIVAQTIPFSGVNAASTAPTLSASTTLATSSTTLVSTASVVTTQVPSQVTVTVFETVTAATSSTVNPPAKIVTVTVTDFADPSATASTTTAADNRIGFVTIPHSQSSGCSTTASVYRLRARNPFDILPPGDEPNTTAGSGC